MSEEQRKFYGSLITECDYWEFDSEINKGKLYDKNGNVIPTYEDLQQENKQLKEVIEEVREYIESNMRYVENDDGAYEPILDGYNIRDILQILDKVKGN